MNCFNCGKSADNPLCSDCRTPEILEKVFNEIRSYDQETCENACLREYAAGLTDKRAVWEVIPAMLDRFDPAIAEYFYCQYFWVRRDSRFEEAALTYIQTHELTDIRTQNVLYELVERYLPDDFIKPQKWCGLISEQDGLACELYAVAAKYYAMIGEYDLADSVTDKALAICESAESPKLIYSSLESMIIRLNKQKASTLRYRTKKPYWPTTEKRRRAVAEFYDKKGIKYPRIESRPAKVPENEFAPIKECFSDAPDTYSAFWCSEAFSVSAAKCIYQIGAVKVVDGKTEKTFESFIRPWDSGSSARKSLAKEAGVELDVIESAADVDIVMPKFFDFVGDDVLVSTGALGNQAKLISRAARYTGMKCIENEFFDLLDFAADLSEEFDLANNTREYLLSFFSIEEGKSALEKAQVNKRIYDALVNYGD